jgi:ABC-type antimicrobial peptide transport system permease subunit
MLCSDFAKLVLVGLIIGCPIAWYLASRFLSAYTFHTELNYWIFVVAVSCILVIALLTVIYQSARASLANPVDALRNE